MKTFIRNWLGIKTSEQISKDIVYDVFQDISNNDVLINKISQNVSEIITRQYSEFSYREARDAVQKVLKQQLSTEKILDDIVERLQKKQL